ncbi:hypothetical protein ACJX0J_015012, partial [Zea mays]
SVCYSSCLTPLGLCLIFRLSLDFILFRATISLYMFSDFINAGLVCLAADANYPKGFRAVDINIWFL